MPRKMAREPQGHAATPAPQERAQVSNKVEKVLTLLRRDGGATLSELTDATGWLPHSARAMLTGLRKNGQEIRRLKRDGVSLYHLVSAKL